ncbi:hypothetical protein AQUSIP_22880 [Aquicella siphonis]|uniref:Polyhydroxyalkanoate synthesis repressor PhaR n=1 Tax=Aquicella siphonis TaxID=254247 RepID=A0A5E4PKL8_9COXI|nr:polyhydroxyalkanoate synthesis repressor PhaR [Aquicella siphonis]VVC76961.1 hypothetical protein AQUSIP_22880 [Aquicella siphonis]
MANIRIIKKYPNRRLYDTELGVYITLDDVKQLVFDRVNFQVIDARTSKDLTQGTLLQIITEQETSSTPIFTTPLLQDLIRSYHEKSQNLFSRYLEQAMHLFLDQKQFFQHQWMAYQQLLSNPELLQQLVKKQKPVPKGSEQAMRKKSRSKKK